MPTGKILLLIVNNTSIYQKDEINMSSLFILGNGFDIAHGMQTKYSDFREFVISLYPESLNLKDEKVYLEDVKSIEPAEFAAEILLHVMDKSCGENWSNFEEELAHINFNAKLPCPNHKEDETDEEDAELMQDYLLYMAALTSGFINCSKIWQDFFRIWIKNAEKQIESGQFTYISTLKNLFNSDDSLFLTFNYTKTLQKLYGIKKVIHIHNRVGQRLIWGHGEKSIMYNSASTDFTGAPAITSTFLDDMIMSFKKDTTSPFKKYSEFFKKLDHQIDKVYSYGFSYGKVDSVYIKKIIEKISPNAIWYFTNYESRDVRALRIKKIKLRKYGFKGEFGVF